MRNILLAWVVLASGLSLSAADFEEIEAGGRTLVVTAGTDLAALGLGDTNENRLHDVLKAVGEEHRLEVQISVAPRARTNYEHDVHYVSRITARDAQDRRDGPEREYTNWYQPAWRLATYKDGEAHGVEQHFTPDGKTLQTEIPWEQGEIHGMRRRFHPDGTVQTETPYIRGRAQGQSRTYDHEGRVIRTVTFDNGRRQGESIDYWPENPEQVQRIIPYGDGQVHGTARAYYLDGALQWERPFRENQLHGVERHYDTKGEITIERHWEEGRAYP